MEALSIRPLTPTVGAEITGVDLTRRLGHDQVDAIEESLLVHGVVFFRDQRLTPAQLLAFARQMGPVSVPPFGVPLGSEAELTVLDRASAKGEYGDEWHSDDTFMPEPPMGSILQAVELPTYGGDTCFASMHAAYDALSEPMRRLLDGLEAVHDVVRALALQPETARDRASLAELRAKWPAVTHPVVRTHPITGRRALFVNGHATARLIGLPARENELLLRFLVDHVRDPLFQCRFRWERGSIAYWDNRSVQHYAVPDYAERRMMYRVTIAGDRPR
jgi:taurine dioxygenase